MSYGESVARIGVFAYRALKTVAIFAAVLIGGALDAAAQQRLAQPRDFTHTYQAEVLAPDAFQFRQWVTWRTSKGTDAVYDYFGFRHELIYGLTHDWQLSLFLSDWYYEKTDAGETQETKWKDVAAQTVYVLSDPATDWIGSALNAEVAGGNDFLELQAKLVLQTDIMDVLTLAYNAGVAAQWDGSIEPKDRGEFEQSFGVSCQVHPNFALGLELLHQIGFPGWEDSDDPLFYLGPVLTARNKIWWVTIAPLFQTTNVDAEPEFQVRLLAGIDL